MSENPNITIEYLLANKDKSWDWSLLPRNPGFSIKDICSHPELPWEMGYIFQNPNITIKDIINFDLIDHLILLYDLSANPGITIKDVIDNLKSEDLHWHYGRLSENKMCYHPYFLSRPYKRKLAKEISAIIRENEDYIRMVFNPNRMRSYTSIQDLEEMRLDYGWSMEEFNEHIK